MPRRGQKRPAAAASSAIAQENGASYRMQARCTGNTRYMASRAESELRERQTPCGGLVKTFEIASTEATAITIEYCCPFAWLHVLASECPRFFEFLAPLLANRIGKVCVYMDETRPGNALRPDMGRAVNSLYWCIANLPDWFRAKHNAWFVIAHVPAKIMAAIKGSSSALLLKILEIFWSPSEWNFERLGVSVAGMHIRLQYGFIMVDEKAEKECFGLKGANGIRMCLSCCNCVRTKRDVADDSGLVLFTEPDMAKFERNTGALLAATLDELRLRKADTGKTEFQVIEKAFGINYDKCVVLYSPYRDMLNLPASRYTDWFHDLVASGGVFQYAVNQVVFDIRELGIPTEEIDAFQRSVRLPVQKLHPTFFADRFVDDRAAHIKAFGSETITAISILCFFCGVRPGWGQRL